VTQAATMNEAEHPRRRNSSESGEKTIDPRIVLFAIVG